MPNDTEIRKRWARDRIMELDRQKVSIDLQIRRLRDFIDLLTSSEAAVHAAGANGSRRTEGKRLGSSTPLLEFLRAALKGAGPSGRSVSEVFERVTEMGYKPKTKTKPRIMVNTEISRRSKDPKNGITRVAPGRYALVEEVGQS